MKVKLVAADVDQNTRRFAHRSLLTAIGVGTDADAHACAQCDQSRQCAHARF
jgi:hypothetical protein